MRSKARWTGTDRRRTTRGKRAYRAAPSSAFPSLQLLLRQRLEELRADAYPSLHRAELTLGLGLLDRHEADDGLVAAGDDHLLAGLGTRDELGKLGLGGMNGHGCHGGHPS